MGFDVKIIKHVLKLREKDKNALAGVHLKSGGYGLIIMGTEAL